MKKIVALVGLLLLAGVLVRLLPGLNKNAAPSKTVQSVIQQTPLPRLDVSFVATESGKSALAVTSEYAKVVSKHYDFGDMVVSINGIEANSKNFWSVYINDTFAETGADKILLQKGDKVDWKYEEIKQ